MKILKANNYYDVNCDAVPDNKVQLVTGHYTTNVNTTSTDNYSDISYVSNIRSTGQSALPIFSSSDLATTTDTFTGVFMDYSNSGSEDDSGSEWYWKQIDETVIGTLVIEIEDDSPLTFISANMTNPEGLYRERHSTSGVMVSMGWITDFTIANSNKIQTVKNYNKSGYPSSTSESSTISSYGVSSTSVDPLKDGTHLINGKYVLQVTIRVEVFTGYQYVEYEEYWDPEAGQTRIRNVSGNLWYNVINKFDLEFTYGKYSIEEVAFSYRDPSATQAEAEKYPLNIEGNMYTSDKTTFSVDLLISAPWWQFISTQIVNEFKNGKLWMQAKVKAKWLIDNNIDINSEVVLKDINNEYIGKSSTYDVYVFKIKNIEYVYEADLFYANICLLESRIVNRYRLVGIYQNGNYINAVLSNGTKVIIDGLKNNI